MENRKFIIEFHPDGKVTWCEYEEAADRLRTYKSVSDHFMNKFNRLCNTADDIVHVGNYSKDYQAGARDAINYLRYHFTR